MIKVWRKEHVIKVKGQKGIPIKEIGVDLEGLLVSFISIQDRQKAYKNTKPISTVLGKVSL